MFENTSNRQLEVAGNPQRSLLRRLKTCDSRFCSCVPRDFQSLGKTMKPFIKHCLRGMRFVVCRVELSSPVMQQI